MGFFLGVAIFLSLIAIYFFFDPSQGFFPKCPFLSLTGLTCPGCGSQRAIHSLLHLEWIMAFKQNALCVVSIPFILLLTYAELNHTSKPKLYATLHRTPYILAYLMVILCWWVIRNICNW